MKDLRVIENTCGGFWAGNSFMTDHLGHGFKDGFSKVNLELSNQSVSWNLLRLLSWGCSSLEAIVMSIALIYIKSSI